VAQVKGIVKWTGTADQNGYVTFKITYLVGCLPIEGPWAAMTAVGLPLYGAWYIMPGGAEENINAWCRWDADAQPRLTAEPNAEFEVTKTFSTKPPDPTDKVCSTQQFSNPLLEPAKISGSFINKAAIYTQDRFGNNIEYSSHEPILGELAKFDKNRNQVKISQNIKVEEFDLPLLETMRDTVNAFPLWGMPARTIKLSNAEWERAFWGTCGMYFKRTLTFEVNEDTFDVNIQDKGKMVLKGHWEKDTTVDPPRFTGNWIVENVGPNPADPSNPKHFIIFKDFHGQPREGLLNGAGIPAGTRIRSEWMVALDAVPATTPPIQLDSAFWAPVNDPSTYIEWSAFPDEVYRRGDLLSDTVTGTWYVVLVDGVLDLDDPNQSDINWHAFTSPFPPGGIDQGPWVEGTAYDEGDIVQVTEDIRAGNIHVEAYDESDFTLLGIPLDIYSF